MYSFNLAVTWYELCCADWGSCHLFLNLRCQNSGPVAVQCSTTGLAGKNSACLTVQNSCLTTLQRGNLPVVYSPGTKFLIWGGVQLYKTEAKQPFTLQAYCPFRFYCSSFFSWWEGPVGLFQICSDLFLLSKLPQQFPLYSSLVLCPFKLPLTTSSCQSRIHICPWLELLESLVAFKDWKANLSWCKPDPLKEGWLGCLPDSGNAKNNLLY